MLVALSIGSIILLMINIEYFHDFLSTGANSYRIYVYKHQLLSIIDNPFGTGVGTTGSIATNLNTDFRMDSESALLSYANEQGILGALYIGVIFTILFKKFSNTLQVFCYTSVILFLFTFQAFPKTPSTMLFILMTVALCQPKNKS